MELLPLVSQYEVDAMDFEPQKDETTAANGETADSDYQNSFSYLLFSEV